MDRVKLATLVENMKEALSIEKHIISLENKISQEDKKSKKVFVITQKIQTSF